jgi:ubiquinone/menaquinone biosynthesis C-methylase UbiE
MQQGDFSSLAKQYINRPAYSEHLLNTLLLYTGYLRKVDYAVADVGAGTGKLTKMLLDRGLHVTAVEPNDSMRQEGIAHTKGHDASWIAGTGESTGLPRGSIDWILMASSFHWTDPEKSLPEFHRALKPGGYFTALWNPRNIEVSELHTRIERQIYEIVPSIRRISSGSKTCSKRWEEVLVSTGHFSNVIFMEVDQVETMPKERYLGAWRSVNDIQSQAGPQKWAEILSMIEDEIAHLDFVEVPYKNRAWTGQRLD